VVGRYLAYDPDAIEIIRLLKESAEEMESALGMEDVDAFGRGIERYWELKKRLDPGSTNEKIEALLKPLNRHLTGRLLTGAGGGGFLFMVARDAEAAARIRRHLEKNPPNPLARFFTFAIDPKGLSVTVL
jgi:galactokinase/mevalonate kinase-like predicted kinase